MRAERIERSEALVFIEFQVAPNRDQKVIIHTPFFVFLGLARRSD